MEEKENSYTDSSDMLVLYRTAVLIGKKSSLINVRRKLKKKLKLNSSQELQYAIDVITEDINGINNQLKELRKHGYRNNVNAQNDNENS